MLVWMQTIRLGFAAVVPAATEKSRLHSFQ